MGLLGPKVLGLLLTPPGVIILIAFVGMLIHIKWYWLGNIITWLSIIALLVLSLPLTGHNLMATVESQAKPLPSHRAKELCRQACAIVVLGGGRNEDAPEYGADTVGAATLERVRYAAYLHRLTGYPILASGGAPFGEKTSDAALMQAALERDFQVRVKWVETTSPTTYENAAHSAAILGPAGIPNIYLVTHAAHMPRAQWAFENAGFNVIPAPTAFTALGKSERTVLGYLPSAGGLGLSSNALHERLGLLWYKLRYGREQPAAAKPRAPAPASN